MTYIKAGLIFEKEVFPITEFKDEDNIIREQFYTEKNNDTGFKIGNICLDLYNDNEDLIDTITITRERYLELTNKPFTVEVKKGEGK